MVGCWSSHNFKVYLRFFRCLKFEIVIKNIIFSNIKVATHHIMPMNLKHQTFREKYITDTCPMSHVKLKIKQV